MTASPLDRLLARPARTATVTLPLDPNVADRLHAARRDLFVAIDGKGATDDEAIGHRARVDQLEAELVTVTFELTAIGSDAVDALMAKHPATKDQKSDARRAGRSRPDLNHATFAPALLAAHATAVTFSDDPDAPVVSLTAAQAAKVLARLSVDDRVLLHSECLRINSETTVLPGGS